ncbi:Rpn family recombination-promoting nuclease/putative transposase [Treponema sp. UBA3813]|uniref:Rpn family recombination-promoting nuclease/putative transposase n=1 Tax=Treponema sp. UBA3813 TaxID=1947715 RepID=UPI0025EF494F|nr:Rpn family recombination-promoting nuclease/putative transposase [Treponema sp. UBA3813]
MPEQKERRQMLNPRLDANFKAIFTQDTEESRIALRSFLTAAIGLKVEGVTVIKNEEVRDYGTQRGLRYDIKCVFDDGTLAQVEMQGSDSHQIYGKRAEYHAARLLSSVLDVGDNWEKIPKTYQISVLDCEFDKTHGDFFHHYRMMDGRDGARLSGTLNVIFMELPKLPLLTDETDIRNLPSIVKWCKFLKEADNPAEQDLIDILAESEEGIMNAETTLANISADRWRWLVQGQIEADKKLATANIYYAKEEGKIEASRENARNLLKMNLGTNEQIAQACSLPLDEVLALKEELAR